MNPSGVFSSNQIIIKGNTQTKKHKIAGRPVQELIHFVFSPRGIITCTIVVLSHIT
jgi:hypothetical protein